jgi:hypothetical protein
VQRVLRPIGYLVLGYVVTMFTMVVLDAAIGR